MGSNEGSNISFERALNGDCCTHWLIIRRPPNNGYIATGLGHSLSSKQQTHTHTHTHTHSAQVTKPTTSVLCVFHCNRSREMNEETKKMKEERGSKKQWVHIYWRRMGFAIEVILYSMMWTIMYRKGVTDRRWDKKAPEQPNASCQDLNTTRNASCQDLNTTKC
jgi:hypothetical protein